jgi:hypothetical protein
MKETNCPNCGAPIVGSKCEYCGTVFASHDTTSSSSEQWIRVEDLTPETRLELYLAKIAGINVPKYERTREKNEQETY